MRKKRSQVKQAKPKKKEVVARANGRSAAAKRTTKRRVRKQLTSVVLTTTRSNELFMCPELNLRVRAFEGEDGEVQFVLQDLVKSLGWVSTASAARILPDEGKAIRVVPTPGGPQQLTVVNQRGLYLLATRSHRRGAQRLTWWLCTGVMPCIRRTGSYSLPGAQPLALPATTPPVPDAQALLAKINEMTLRVAEHDKLEERFIHVLKEHICREEGIDAVDLALELGCPSGRNKPFTNLPPSELQRVKKLLQQRLLDRLYSPHRNVERPDETTWRYAHPERDFSPQQVVALLEERVGFACDADDLSGPLGLYQGLRLHPLFRHPDEGDDQPYLDSARVEYVEYFVNKHPRLIQMLQVLLRLVHVDARLREADEMVDDGREAFEEFIAKQAELATLRSADAEVVGCSEEDDQEAAE